MKTASIGALFISAALALCSCASSGAAAHSAATEPGTIVPVARVERADLANDLTLTAEFEPFQQIDVMAKVAGYVKSIKVDIGDRVRAGQMLASLEIPEMDDDLARASANIDQAEAEITTASDELRRAEAAHELAHLSFTRIQKVIQSEPGLVPQQEVDEARSRDLIAEAQISAAKSTLQTAQQRARVARAEQARIQTLRKYTSISAPFEGVITKRYANEGAMIQAGTASQTQALPIVQLSQNSLLRLILPVPESVVSHVHVGQSVDVLVTSLDKTFPGRVARFAEKIQPSTRTMDTEVDVPNPGLTLVPGMYAEGKLRVDQRRNVLAIPLDALDRSGSAVLAAVVAQDGAVRIARVDVGLETALLVEVLSGLKEGELVVVGRRAGLKDGQRVQPKLIGEPAH